MDIIIYREIKWWYHIIPGFILNKFIKPIYICKGCDPMNYNLDVDEKTGIFNVTLNFAYNPLEQEKTPE